LKALAQTRGRGEEEKRRGRREEGRLGLRYLD
jgi:hypothetical protein